MISRVINLHEYESINDVITLGAAHLIAVARGQYIPTALSVQP